MTDEPDHMDIDELWAALPDSSGYRRGDILFNLAQRLMGDDTSAAFAAAEQAAAAFAELHLNREQMWCTDLMAHCRDLDGDPQGAHDLHIKAMTFLDPMSSTIDRGSAYSCAGTSAKNLNRYAESIEHFTNALNLAFDEPGDHDHAIAGISRELGDLCSWSGGRVFEMIDHYQRALDSGHCDSHALVYLRGALSRAATEMRFHEDAISHARRAMALSKSHDCQACETSATGSLAVALERAHRNREAGELFDKLAELGKQQNRMSLVARAMLGQARLMMDENPEAARTLALDALGVASDDKVRIVVRIANETLARIARRMGEHALAVKYLEAAIDSARDLVSMSNVYRMQRVMAQDLIALGRASEAVALLAENGWVADVRTADSPDRAEHVAAYAQALVAARRGDQGIAVADQLLAVLDDMPHSPAQAVAHHVRASVLRHRDPIAAEHAAGKALAFYTLAEERKAAADVAFEYFCLPLATLKVVADDHDRRVELEAEEAEEAMANELNDVASMGASDPIESQVTGPVFPETEREGGVA